MGGNGCGGWVACVEGRGGLRVKWKVFVCVCVCVRELRKNMEVCMYVLSRYVYNAQEGSVSIPTQTNKREEKKTPT